LSPFFVSAAGEAHPATSCGTEEKSLIFFGHKKNMHFSRHEAKKGKNTLAY